jgi:glucose/arabinose dehydrogenase
MIRPVLPAFFAATLFIQPAFAEAPGDRFKIVPADLPKPYATPATASRSVTIPRTADDTLTLPKGFHANIFAENLTFPRELAVAENGDVYVTESNAGKVTLLRDTNGDGKADETHTFADDFERPYGIAFRKGILHVADARSVWEMSTVGAANKNQSQDRMPLTMMDAFGNKKGHWTRNIAFDSKGGLYVAIGSEPNAAEDPDPRATIQTVTAYKLEPFATGLRNPVGLAFYPGTDDLYTVVNERDGLGDGLVPDYLTRVQKGDFYGWPYVYSGRLPDPVMGDKRPDLVAKTKTPDVLFEAHSAALDLVFYTGSAFPEAYRKGAFVSLHGSWNASKPTGYKIVFVPFENGRPSGGYENFALGFRKGDTAPAQVIGRPVGLAEAKDGSLLIADDIGKVIWRVAYTGK